MRKAIIFGIKGTNLTSEEKYILRTHKPWGIILFSRNINNFAQLKKLVNDIKKIFRDKNYPILIDQEGGAVSRLNKFIDFSIFSQDFFGKLYLRDNRLFNYFYNIYIFKVCEILKSIGININTVPVLDVRSKHTHKFIINRTFSNNSLTVGKIGKFCIDLYNKNKIATVIKHIPGHGLSKSDSHFKLPIIISSKSELNNKDFKPFKMCSSIFAMTAHVVYSSYDPFYCATHSKIVISEAIRKKIGFKGILISDDISMKALKYDLQENATRALDAGCNLVMHCNGNIEEMNKLVKIIPTTDKFTQKKTSQFYNFLR